MNLRLPSGKRSRVEQFAMRTVALFLFGGLAGCVGSPDRPKWQPVEPRLLAAQSAYGGRMTPALAAEVLTAAIRARHERDDRLQLTSLEITPERFRYGCIFWKEQQGWNPERTVSVDISWYAVRQAGVNLRVDRANPVYSIWFRFMTRDVERLFHVGSAIGCSYSAADVMLALATLIKQPLALPLSVSGSSVVPPIAASAQPMTSFRTRDSITQVERQQRIQQLDRLYQRGQLSEEIYRAMRRELLLAPVSD